MRHKGPLEDSQLSGLESQGSSWWKEVWSR